MIPANNMKNRECIMKCILDTKCYTSKMIVKFCIYIYELIFHETASHEVIIFIHNFLYVAAGTMLATFFSFAFNILGGRFLGPTGYGEFTLVRTISMFLYIPMLLGVSTSMVKYNSEKIDINRQKAIISTSYMIIFIFTTATISLYIVLSAILTNIFSISTDLYILSIILSLLFAFYTLTTDTLRSLHKMKLFGLLKPIHNLILLSSFLIFASLNIVSFKSMLFSLYFAYMITGIAILLLNFKYFYFHFNFYWAKILLKYSCFTVFGAFSYMLYTNIDKLLINKYMSIDSVGTYNAYYFGSIEVIALFAGIFITIFFPTASRYENKNRILDRLNKLVLYIVILGFPFILLSEFIILNFYGDKYPIDFLLMSMFAIASILVVCYDLYGWLFNSEGTKGVQVTLTSTIAIAITNILLNVYTIPRYGLYGAIGSTSLAYFVGICIIYVQKNKIFGKINKL